MLYKIKESLRLLFWLIIFHLVCAVFILWLIIIKRTNELQQGGLDEQKSKSQAYLPGA